MQRPDFWVVESHPSLLCQAYFLGRVSPTRNRIIHLKRKVANTATDVKHVLVTTALTDDLNCVTHIHVVSLATNWLTHKISPQLVIILPSGVPIRDSQFFCACTCVCLYVCKLQI